MKLIDQLRAAIAAELDQRDAAQADLDAVVSGAEARGDGALTDDEAKSLQEKRAEVRTLDEALAAKRAHLSELEEDAKRKAAAAEHRLLLPAGEGVVRKEARTYRPDAPASFFADLFASTFRTGAHWDAEARLQRHNHEASVERRDIAVSAMAGAIPPQYLVDQFAPVARAGRPFLNSLNALPLPPEGVSFVVPRGTTGSAAAQTSEGAGFNEQDMANTDLTLTVNLTSAQQDVSRTLFMRGGAVVDSIIFPDLLSALAVAADTSALNGNGTAPQHRGVLQVSGISAVTYTDGTPTVPEAWPKLSDAIQRINSLRFMPGNVIYMHPRRWGWITSAVDSTGRPLFEFSTVPPNSVMGLGTAAEYGQVVGKLQGLPVVTDANIPTTLGGGTEDIIIAARSLDFLFWEDDVMQFTFEQTLSTAPGQVRLAVGQFQLFTAGRYPTGISTIGGTGFVTPTF